MIEINDLSFSYGRNVVLQGITLNMLPGRIYGLLGENGVGKTTLLTLMCGLKTPQAGTAIFLTLAVRISAQLGTFTCVRLFLQNLS